MDEIEKEVTIIELKTKEGKRFKVTKRVPLFHLSTTKVFENKEEALSLFNEWLDD
ncbi:MAG: hypothetical protein WC595_03075 [Candidatus Nanoarchaeia archaeon]